MKFCLFLISLLFTAIFLDYKISKIARVIAFKETETQKESKVSFCCLIIAVIIWAIYLY